MPIIASDAGGGDFQPTPTGMVQAVCVFVQDVGHEEYQGKMNHKVIISFELAHRITEGPDTGKRHMLSNTYTVSLNPKSNLRADLESWRGRGFTPDEAKAFDLERLIGKNCLVNVVEYTRQDGKKSVKIGSISPLMPGMATLTPETLVVPAWIAKRREQNAVNAAKLTNHQASTVREPPRDEWQQMAPASMARPQERLVTEGRVPLSQPTQPPLQKYVDSPPPGPYVNDEPPF